MKQASAIGSVAKTTDTLMAHSGQKQQLMSDQKSVSRPRSPLPIQIEMVSDNYSDAEALVDVPHKMRLDELLCIDLPKKRTKNWQAYIAQLSAAEAKEIKHVNLSACKTKRSLLSTACPSANLGADLENASLGKRSAKTSSVRAADIRDGVDLGLLKWHSITFSADVVAALKKKHGVQSRDRRYLVEVKCETL